MNNNWAMKRFQARLDRMTPDEHEAARTLRHAFQRTQSKGRHAMKRTYAQRAKFSEAAGEEYESNQGAD